MMLALVFVSFLVGRLTQTTDAPPGEAREVPPGAVKKTAAERLTRASSASCPNKPTVNAALQSENHDEDVLTGLLLTPSEELVAITEGVGKLARLDSSAAARAWNSLTQRPPRDDYVGSLVAAFLWSRQVALYPDTPLPAGWGLENYPGLKATIQMRPNLEQVREDLLAGKPVPYAERRLFFQDALSKEPVVAFSLWLNGYSAEARMDEVSWFGRLLENPEQRAALLKTLNDSPLDKDARCGLLSQLISEWTAKDPAAVEAWINDPALAPYQEQLRATYAAIRCRTNPQEAWSLSEELPPEARFSAQLTASSILAREQPDMGIQRINEITDPGQREEMLKFFGQQLATSHYDKWLQWRDSLPQAEQDQANESGFQDWVTTDTAAALKWLETRPPGPQKMELMSQFASRFSMNNPEEVAAWIRTLPNPNDRLTAAMSGLRGLPDTDHDAIRKILDALR